MSVAQGQPLVVEEKKVTWLELFFDLVFVFAVTRTSELVQDDHSWPGIVRAVIVFVPVYWAWVGTTMHANMHDVDTVRGRLGVFGVALCGLVLALALPTAWEETAMLFAAAYWAARIVLLLAIQGLPHRSAFGTFTVGAFVTGPAFVVGALLPDTARLLVWGLAALTDLGVPYLLRRRLASAPFEPGHLSERYGTFVIIALGETVVATGTAAAEHHLDAVRLAAMAAAFVVCCGLWWVYFVFSSRAIHDALESASARIEIIRPVLSYGHLGLVGGIIAIAAAIGHAVAEPDAALHLDVAALLFGGAALYMVTFAANRWRMFHTLATPRLIAAAVFVAAIALAPHVPAIWTLAALGVLLIALNVIEHTVVPKTLHR